MTYVASSGSSLPCQSLLLTCSTSESLSETCSSRFAVDRVGLVLVWPDCTTSGDFRRSLALLCRPRRRLAELEPKKSSVATGLRFGFLEDATLIPRVSIQGLACITSEAQLTEQMILNRWKKMRFASQQTSAASGLYFYHS